MTSVGTAVSRLGTRDSAAGAKPDDARSMLEQLLHALNQPLTGLQCSMEVALVAPRSPEHYVRTLREGLELTGRMRSLVGAIREVVDAQNHPEGVREEGRDGGGILALENFLQEAMEELAPVAAAKQVRFAVEYSAEVPTREIKAAASRMKAACFRLVESVVSLAEQESAIRAEATGSTLRLHWKNGRVHDQFSIPELGLLVAQAVIVRTGVAWQDRRNENRRTITIQLPGLSESSQI
jgi:hypothetical protein